MKDFGILVFGHTRALHLADVLESLKRQNALEYVDLWIDGYQGNLQLKNKVHLTQKVADDYDVGVRRYHQGQLGFRKLMIQAMQSAVNNYRHVLFLEDDCFPIRNAVEMFRTGLKHIEVEDDVFSIYGHPFKMAEDSGYCTRFQGWGWATTAEKLAPYVEKLIECYSMSEQDYLEYVDEQLTPEVEARLDVTPPRIPTAVLREFFAWDETLALLTAIDRKRHKLTDERVIYNCGMGDDSSHFGVESQYFQPPFNLLRPERVWDMF